MNSHSIIVTRMFYVITLILIVFISTNNYVDATTATAADSGGRMSKKHDHDAFFIATAAAYFDPDVHAVTENASTTSMKIRKLHQDSNENSYILIQQYENRRHLTFWSSFMNFIKCPPGPLGKKCHEDDNNNQNSSSSSNNNGSSNSNSDGSSSSSSNSSRSSSNNNDDNPTHSSSAYWNNYVDDYSNTEEASSEYTSDETTTSYQATASNVTSWLLLISGLIVLSAIFATVAYKSSQGNGIMLTGDDDGHTLDGSVQKRLRAFSTAYYNRFGNPDMNSKKEPILPSSSQREQIA